jgi:flagellar protein FliO/FliZ
VSLSLFSIGKRVLPVIVVLSIFPLQPVPAQQQVTDESLLPIAGEDTQPRQAEQPQVSLVSSWDFVRMLLVLGAVVVVIYLVFRLLRRGLRRRLPQNDLIRLLGTRALTGNRALHVVELGNKVFLVGAAENGISLISEITDQETLDTVRLATSQAPPQTFQGFAQFLQSFLRAPRKQTGSTQDTLDFMKQQRQRLQKL